jgi:integrase
MSTGKLRKEDIAKLAPDPGKPWKRKSDGGGLYIEARANGSRYWRLGSRFKGKQKVLALGTWPDVSRELARQRRDDARKLLAQDVDPSERGNDKHTFMGVAAEWVAKAQNGNSKRAPWSERHLARVKFILDNDLKPHVGHLPVGEIRPADFMRALRAVEKRGALQTIVKVKGVADAVMAYAVGHGLAETNTARDIKLSLFDSAPVRHHATITDPVQIGAVLRNIRAYEGYAVVRLALELAPMLMLRPGELRSARWADIDLAGALWTIEAGRTKQRRKHLVPLPRQAVEILRELHDLTGPTGNHSRTGRGLYVFPSIRTYEKPISENTLNAALRAMGYAGDQLTTHGFRSMASTLLNEEGTWTADAIERQLAHVDSNSIRSTYNYAEHLPERRKMLQSWADRLDKLRAGAEVVELRAGLRDG